MGWGSALTEPEWTGASELLPHYPSTEWASSAGDASSGRGKFSFPCIKKAGSPAVFEVLAAEAFPLLRNLTQNPLRGSCQRRLPGNRLLFSLCFHVQVRASWASLSVAPAEWVYEGFSTPYSPQVQLLRQNDWDGQKTSFPFCLPFHFFSFSPSKFISFPWQPFSLIHSAHLSRHRHKSFVSC